MEVEAVKDCKVVACSESNHFEAMVDKTKSRNLELAICCLDPLARVLLGPGAVQAGINYINNYI